MYAAIGYGGVTSLKLIGRLREDIQRILKMHQEDRAVEEPLKDEPGKTRPAVPKRTKSEQGIVVEGLSNCLVKFAKCCTPVPGDDIVGFITGAMASPSTGRIAPMLTRPAQARGEGPLDQGILGR